jgi:hypothetical protein
VSDMSENNQFDAGRSTIQAWSWLSRCGSITSSWIDVDSVVNHHHRLVRQPSLHLLLHLNSSADIIDLLHSQRSRVLKCLTRASRYPAASKFNGLLRDVVEAQTSSTAGLAF